MHRRVPPPVAQMTGVPQRSFEHQPSAPQDGRGRDVAGVAGPLSSLHGWVRERDAQEQMSDPGSANGDITDAKSVAAFALLLVHQ